MKKLLFFLLLLPSSLLWGQNTPLSSSSKTQLAPLTVKKIMRDPQWIGTSPSQLFWSPDSKKLYFKWNPEKNIADSLYFITPGHPTPQKAKPEERRRALAEHRGSWNADKTRLVFREGHTLYLLDVSSQKLTPILKTAQSIRHPKFAKHGTALTFRMGKDLYLRNLKTGAFLQLTHFKKGHKPSSPQKNKQKAFLEHDALENSKVLRQRKHKRELRKENRKKEAHKGLTPTYIGKARVDRVALSPDGHYVYYRLKETPHIKHTIVPNYVTQSGYPQDIPGRPVVGVKQPHFSSYLYNRKTDESHKISIDQIPGIRDIPKFIKAHYPEEYKAAKKKNSLRSVIISAPVWNRKGNRAAVVISSQDHKDRWIMLLNEKTGQLKLLDRQHDNAWIAGPGIGYIGQTGNIGWINEHTLWYQSEKTGYSHLYTQDIRSKKQRALTSGKYEVQKAVLSPDRTSFYLLTNKVEPGQKQFYHLRIKTKKQTRMTHKEGGYRVVVSPDGKYAAELFSTTIDPWELYLQRNTPGAKEKRITHKAESPEYQSYSWRMPTITTFKDRDGFDVYTEIYRPQHQASTRPGVIFVHGAGYLQDVLKYWGYYFREHMFINLLVDHGYTVMDIDYRGSAGYGRDWRTAIYRHMGGNDLADIVDGAKYMVKNLHVNPDNIGIWGGSYGGFMTLMAMFKTPVFKSGGALRSVTDWAHYNHGYTSAILNLPQNDSIAYQQSSPIYFADGLQGHLLMCHGMVDTNVHFQDIVRVTQKLIELGKTNWELAVYPVESHGFVEPSSWTDEYRRIFKLFEKTLK